MKRIRVLDWRIYGGEYPSRRFDCLDCVFHPTWCHAPIDAELDAVAHLLLGAMNEAALWIARSEDPAAALAHAKAGLDRLLGGLRAG